MANNLKRTRSTVDKIAVKGVLSEDGTTITYVDENNEEQEVSVSDCLYGFRDKTISFTVQVKTDEELKLEFTEADTE